MSRNLKAITMYEWANEMNCAVTVCDTEGVILYMNEKACRTFAKHGNLIGRIYLIVITRNRRTRYVNCLKREVSMLIPLRRTESGR